MPAQSGDPISSAIQSSLVNSNLKKDSSDISSLLTYSTKQVLLVDIKYEEYHSDSSSFLGDLKSKYVVISEKDQSEPNQSESANPSGKFVLNKANFDKSNGLERSNGLDRTDVKVSKPKLPSPDHVLWPPENISLGWTEDFPVGGGFINLGNSCYINSTLQALYHIPSFVNWLLVENSHTCPVKPPYSSADCLICAMAQTLKSAQDNTGKAIKPYLIFSRLKSICKHLNPGLQADAHEFLRHLIDTLDRTYLLPYKGLRLDHLSKETTPLSQIFGGYLRNEVVCQSCGHVSTTFQYFQDMPLDICNASHIDGALELFFSRESLGELEGYVCENCKKKVPFTKKFYLEKAPKVLCVQLKRFGSFSGKNNKIVGISQKLNLNRFKAIKNGESFECYQLMAVVNHLGTSANCGHYTALAMASDYKYYLFDDQRVESLHDMNQYSSHAYILLYEQKPNTSNIQNGVKPELTLPKVNNSAFSKSPVPPGSSLLKSKYLNKENSGLNRVWAETCSKEIDNDKSAKTEADDKKEEEEVGRDNIDDKQSSFIGPLEPQMDVNKSLVPYNESSSSSSSSSSSESEVSRSREQSRCTTPELVTSGGVSSTQQGTRTPSLEANNDSCSNGPSTLMAATAAASSTKSSESSSLVSSSLTNGVVTTVNNNNNNNETPKTNGHSSSSNPKHRYNGNGDNRGSGGGGGGGSCSRSNGGISTSSTSSAGSNNSSHWSSWKVIPSYNKTNSPNKSANKNSWKVKSTDQERVDYKSQLMDMGHRGYGKQVSTWSGEKSELEKEVNRENFINQRLTMTGFEDKYETPVKKVKKYHNGNFDSGKNRFQELQKRKNWLYSKGKYNYYERPRQPSNDGYHRPRQWQRHHI